MNALTAMPTRSGVPVEVLHAIGTKTVEEHNGY